MNRQKLALFILLIILALAVAWSFMSLPRQKKVATLKYAPGKTTAPVQAAAPSANALKPPATPAAPSDERALRLDLLEQEQSGFKGYRRNIFKPIL